MKRPLSCDLPQDETGYVVEDQYLFGPNLLVAPVLDAGGRTRAVYLPPGPTWTNVRTGETHAVGQAIDASVALAPIPVFCGDGFQSSLA